MKKQVNIYDILIHLEKRKGMFLGTNFNFKSLDSFITGFQIAASAEQLRHDKYPDFNFFSIWLLGHLKKHFGLAGGWYWQIYNRNLKNDEKAFKEFFSFLEAFKKAKLSKRELTLTEDAIAYHKKNIKQFRIVEGKQVKVINKPVKIVWTTFSNSTTILLDHFNKNDKTIGGSWEINAKEATKRLRGNFGEYKEKWKKVHEEKLRKKTDNS